MRHIEAITEHEMVAAFLNAEVNSARFQREILDLLRRDGRDRCVIDFPNTADLEENDYRIRLLGDFRGYKQNRELFEGFPDDVSWHRYAISKEELMRVRYIDYSYWNELSGGTRLPADAAKNVRAGIEVFGQSTAGLLDVARALENNANFPEPILVGTKPGSDLVVLEGHVRLTAYFLAPHCIPEELTAIIGFSPKLADWMSI